MDGSGRYSNHKPSLRALQFGLLTLLLVLLAPRSRRQEPAVDARTSMLLRARYDNMASEAGVPDPSRCMIALNTTPTGFGLGRKERLEVFTDLC